MATISETLPVDSLVKIKRIFITRESMGNHFTLERRHMFLLVCRVNCLFVTCV